MAATQGDTLRIFTALHCLQETWGGSLLVSVGLNNAGRALALAALAAGAASICLEADAAQIREAQREGCCTCTVTSLDEALRIVKNEVRQRHAITVALRGDPGAWLQDMVSRGVQPQTFAASRVLEGVAVPAVDTLCARGMMTLRDFGAHSTRAGSIDLEDALTRAKGKAWSLHEQVASSLTERHAQDRELLAATPQADAMGSIATRWLQAAPALFPRALERSYWRKD